MGGVCVSCGSCVIVGEGVDEWFEGNLMVGEKDECVSGFEFIVWLSVFVLIKRKRVHFQYYQRLEFPGGWVFDFAKALELGHGLLEFQKLLYERSSIFDDRRRRRR